MFKKSATELYYDNLASKYDELTSVVGAWNAPSEVHNTLKYVSNVSSALIIGIGTGKEIASLINLDVSHIEGVDLSSKMLDICTHNYPKVILHHADFMGKVNLQAKKFDLIICSGTSEFIPDIRGLFLKCSNLLNIGGSFLFTFEPLIDYHSIQGKSQSSSKSSALGNIPPPDFITYRRKLFEILETASNNSFAPTFHKEYVSYRKGLAEIIYHLILFKLSPLNDE